MVGETEEGEEYIVCMLNLIARGYYFVIRYININTFKEN